VTAFFKYKAKVKRDAQTSKYLLSFFQELFLLAASGTSPGVIIYAAKKTKIMQLEIFKFNAGDHFDTVRTVDIDGEIWFVAADVVKVLGYQNPHTAIARHCKERGLLKREVPTSSGTQTMILINEPNVYRLIVKSQLPSAEKFEAWIFEEVIPAIRKHGSYGIDRYKTPNFVLRYFENANKIPLGFFSVITELYLRLYGKLEHAGYRIPDKGFGGKEIRPDVSVGKCFSAYLKANFPSVQDEFETYTHTFPSGFECEARLYPLELISIFIRYVEEVWIPQKAEQYFYERDRKALDFLPKILPAA
jgi:prophage antirepressor-like protein